tara:strand:- start:2799 stop:3134 length:336 start_codon:yes stop_codon:yes gene_type:complete
MPNKLSNKHFEYKGKDELVSLTVITDYDRQYKYGLPSPQEVVEDLIEKTKQEIQELNIQYEFRGFNKTDLEEANYQTTRTILGKQLRHFLYLYEDINKGELEYDIAREGSE